ncbi:ice-binding family protein [Patescibacteria group bacterium]|nr:ice-binding family protein [Patescibacteria group bacterium]
MSIKMFFKLRYLPVIALALMVAPVTHAATTPSLGAADTYAILAGTYTNTTAGTTLNGDLGYTTGPATVPTVNGTIYGSGAPTPQARIDATAALALLDANPCTENLGVIVNLSTVGSHPTGVYTPGVYCSTGAMSIGTAGITLDGAGTYIFRSDGALTSVDNSLVRLVNGASSCDVFWTPTAATTLGADTTFRGTIIDNANAITIGSNTQMDGRALSLGAGTVTTNENTITRTCLVSDAAPGGSTNAPPLINVRKVPNPLALPAGPGPVTYSYTLTNPGTITMTDITLVDDKCTNTAYVSGDTNLNGWMETSETWMYTCTTMLDTTTVNYATARGLGNGMAAVDTAIAQVIVGIPVVPPLINIVKTPAPLTLPFSGGSVVYSYVVTNPGTVALSNVTVTDNRCSNVTRVSGDVNNDSLLQVSETWRYTCTSNIPATTVNTAIATGQANGLTAVDTALATVVVAGLPLPPLIHIVKMPAPVLLPVGGGSVTYTYAVTNPGTVALSNVGVTDDRCGPVNVVSGDGNGNGLMETYETWLYSCVQNLTAATTNTATASGQANGITVTDVAVASVAISPAIFTPPVPTAPSPKLPSTGFNPQGGPVMWMFATMGLLLAMSLLFALTKWKKFF